MATISLCMIVKNEQDVIGRCLECVKDIVDEIIIVDTGSSDRTKEIANEYTDKVFDFKWIDDFAAARNESFSKATKEYVMWLDADDIIEENDRVKLKDLKNNLDPKIDIVMMKYDVVFDENGNTTYSYYRERIIKRSISPRWVGEIHEVINLSGVVAHYEIAIKHKKEKANEPNRNIAIFEKMIENGKMLDPRQKYYYGRELFYHGKYEKAVKELEEFLQEGKGWVENNIGACQVISDCYLALGKEKEMLEALYRSFDYDEPRAEVCCSIANHYFRKSNYKSAIFWYETATTRKLNLKGGGFILPDCYDFTPYLQLCVCYFRIGEKEKAQQYNEKAGKIKPQNKQYLFNKNFFEKE